MIKLHHKVSHLRRHLYTKSNQLRGARRTPLQLQVGDNISGFDVKEIQSVPEFQLTGYTLEHKNTGAKYIHIDTDDTNNVFSINFRTPPAWNDSSGVSHILEHVVLCGSEKFPVRDPFFNMIKRSLNTYMNACTSADMTSYPFSTTNAKDYYNLMRVYLDAAFFPLLTELDFRQEGYRLDFKDNNLVEKGVVLNEMKGVYSDNSNLFATRLQQMMLPGTTYAACSGGDPKEIPNITWQQLKQFHKLHYHPSNCMFYSYGDLNPAAHLSYIEQEVLTKFRYSTSSASVGVVPLDSMASSQDWVISCPSEGNEEDNGIRFCMSKVVGPSTEGYETMVFQIISHLLLSGPSSPLYQALIESGLGKDYVSCSGYDPSSLDTLFNVGVQGISLDQVEDIKKSIMEALQKVAEVGFDPRRIDSIVHQIELSQKHMVSDFGRRISSAIASRWCHGDIHPVSTLQIDKHIHRLQDELAKNPNYLAEIVQHRLMDNYHTLLMIPDQKVASRDEEATSRRLKELQSYLSTSDVEQIKKVNAELEFYQSSDQNVEVLPTLTLDDIPRRLPVRTQVEHSNILGRPSQSITMPTNDICYIRGLFDIASMPLELKPYLPLFASVLTQLGTMSFDHRELSVKIEGVSGGISASPVVASDSNGDIKEYLSLNTMCLSKNVTPTFELLRSIIKETNFFNSTQLQQLLSMISMNATNSLSNSGHQLAQLHAASKLTDISRLKDNYDGIFQIRVLRALSTLVNDDSAELDQLSSCLNEIARRIFVPEGFRSSMVVNASSFDRCRDELHKLVSSIPSLTPNNVAEFHQFTDCRYNDSVEHSNSFFTIPSTVNFVSQCFPTVSMRHDDYATLVVLSQIISSCFLHNEVREKGGAYGCVSSQDNGVFSITSYFDPNTTATLQAYETSISKMGEGKFDDKDITEAKLSLFGGIDSPTPPSAKGRNEFLRGLDDSFRQSLREKLLDVTREDIVDACHKYLVLDRSSRTIVGSSVESIDSNDWIISEV